EERSAEVSIAVRESADEIDRRQPVDHGDRKLREEREERIRAEDGGVEEEPHAVGGIVDHTAERENAATPGPDGNGADQQSRHPESRGINVERVLVEILDEE